MINFATFLKRLLDEVYPKEAREVIAADKLNTLCAGSLYDSALCDASHTFRLQFGKIRLKVRSDRGKGHPCRQHG